MAVLYLVRHGESQANRLRVFDGRELPLTELGRRQAAAVAAHLGARPLAAVYASPYRRALETAAAIAASAGLAVTEVDDLQEVRVGVLAGRRDPAAHNIYNGVYRAWLAGDPEARFPGGETLAEACARMRRFLEVVAARHAGQEVAAVSHGGMPETVLPVLLGLELGGAGSPPRRAGDGVPAKPSGFVGVRRSVAFAAVTTLRLDQARTWVVDARDWGAVGHLAGVE